MDSLFSFPVGLFHPLQHAGLSRRTPEARHYIPYPANTLTMNDSLIGDFRRDWRVTLFPDGNSAPQFVEEIQQKHNLRVRRLPVEAIVGDERRQTLAVRGQVVG